MRFFFMPPIVPPYGDSVAFFASLSLASFGSSEETQTPSDKMFPVKI